jgi:nucleoside-diphosphate-sugar epimerase
MEDTLAREYEENQFPGTVVHPGHIVCPGDPPVNPQGHKNMAVFAALRAGEPLYLPNFGLETVHHVHAKDVAGVFFSAIKSGRPAWGEGFHAVSPRAVTLRGFAEEVAGWFGQNADLHFEPYDSWKERLGAEENRMALAHLQHSPNCSMDKANYLLGFTPEYSSYRAVRECVGSFPEFAELQG